MASHMLNAQEVQDVIYQGLPAASEEGLRVEAVGERRARVRSPFRPSTIRPGGTLSGPTMMGLADAAMWVCVMSQAGEVQLAVTTNLNINFLRKPEMKDVIAEGRLLKLGKSLAVMDVTLYTVGQEDKPVAHATGTYSIPPVR